MSHEDNVVQFELTYRLSDIPPGIMVVAIRNARALAVAACIEHDDLKTSGQRSCNPGPAQPVVSEPMRQHQRARVHAGPVVG